MNSIISILGLLLLGIAVCQAQGTLDAQLSKAEKVFKAGDINSALDMYLDIAVNNPDSYDANRMVGECYLKSQNKILGADFFKKAYKLDSTTSIELLFKIGCCYQMGYNFTYALRYFNRYKAKLNRENTPNMNDVMVKVGKRIHECENGRQYFTRHNSDYVIENVGNRINSIYDDYVPCITSDDKSLIFTSRRPGGVNDKKGKDNEYYEDIWISTKNKSGVWEYPSHIGNILNSADHDANVAMSSDGKKLYLRKDKNNGDIFVSEKKSDGSWSVPVNIGSHINTSKYNEPSVHVTNDGNTIYFSSNRPGGYGGFDLYKVKLGMDGKWSDPVNLGSVINSEYDEDAPFFDPNHNLLYFSSSGHDGMGGYDIFTSRYNERNDSWGEAVNLGYPINSPDDDIYLVLTGDGNSGYYSTNRGDGYGERDIYKFHTVDDKEFFEKHQAKHTVYRVTDDLVWKPQPSIKQGLITGTITDKTTNVPVEAKVYVFDRQGNLVATAMVESNGAFKVNVAMSDTSVYSITVSKRGYLPETYSGIKYDKVSKSFKPISVKATKISNGQVLNVDNIYFETNKAYIKDKSFSFLDVLADWLNENSDLEIEIGGHSDNTGNAAYNKTLSLKRASAVMLYLVAKEIDQSRFSVFGYGQERPIASNSTEEGRAKNRRTEFKIVKTQ